METETVLFGKIEFVVLSHSTFKTERPPPLTKSGPKQGGVVQIGEVLILALVSENRGIPLRP